jgi:hypothetical protein
MEERKPGEAKRSNKGGRPKKMVRYNRKLTVMCTEVDRVIIKAKARNAQLTVSEYLRLMGRNGKVDRREKVLPKEVLALSATLNHLAANLNQIAKKRNGVDELNALERAELQYLSGQCKGLAIAIKNHLK